MNQLIVFFVGLGLGTFQILKHKHDSVIVVITATLMICTYLLFMATLPKETNLISFFMSKYSREDFK